MSCAQCTDVADLKELLRTSLAAHAARPRKAPRKAATPPGPSEGPSFRHTLASPPPVGHAAAAATAATATAATKRPALVVD